ncbi:hypothetical protein [Streptomyces sp. NPDC001530]|uniref:hypothetical protein n=1 Tax=Streptomyces sp. NPDC001530 TaxID=3364582 RepID=UPI00369B4340
MTAPLPSPQLSPTAGLFNALVRLSIARLAAYVADLEQQIDDRRILRAAPKDSTDWDDATWAAWWRAAARAHGDGGQP